MKKGMQPFFQPSFVLCVVILAVAASTKEYTIQKLGIHFIKFPLPLQKSFEELDETKLSPYRVLNKARITNRDVLETLGTEDYLQWELEDPDASADSPVRRCSLFITYYTGNPDMVPHVPDECYVGGGNKRMSGQVIRIPLSVSAEMDADLPESIGAQSVLFSQTGQGPVPVEHRYYVQYFFKANGKYAAGRTETRSLLGRNFFSKYSYFCKVEWKFYGADFAGIVYPDPPQIIEASEKLLSILLPILENEYWPDWEAANQPNDEESETQT